MTAIDKPLRSAAELIRPASRARRTAGGARRRRRALCGRDYARVARLIDPADPMIRSPRNYSGSRRTDGAARGAGGPDRRRRARPVEGVVHCYPDRVLLKPVQSVRSTAGSVPSRDGGAARARDAVAPVRSMRRLGTSPSTSEIWEVFFTGGDPCAVGAAPARSWRLAAIDHMKSCASTHACRWSSRSG